jgi:hypothetical protein
MRLEQYYVKRGWGEVTWDFYSNLLMRLELTLNLNGSGTVQYPVYAVGYDWRKSVLENGALLAAKLDAILARHPLAEKAAFVTHSMGGLVTRAALPQIESKVRGVVHCVLPADGAVVAYRRFQTGASTPFDSPQSETPGTLETVGQWVLNAIMGSDPVSYAMCQSGLRGPTELLPSNNYETVFLETIDGNNRTLGDVYSIYAREGPPGIVPNLGANTKGLTPLSWLPSDAAELRARIDGARATHAKLGRKFHPNTVSIYGDDCRTDVHFNWNRGLVNQLGDEDDLLLKVTQYSVDQDPENHSFITGDGTVPVVSARLSSLPSNRRFRVDGAEHATCFNKTEFMDQLEKSLIPML